MPGLTYQMQVATDIGAADPWQDIGAPITAGGYTSGIEIDMSADGPKLYRVVQVTVP